ncbi:MAG: hypothetical protein AAF530_14500 [Pseudomonadota bacterium]
MIDDDFCSAERNPMTVSELHPAEALFLRCFRSWVLGIVSQDTRHWDQVWNTIGVSFPADDRAQVMSHFIEMIRSLELHGRRVIHHHQPDCPCVGPDELKVLTLLAACQNRRPHLARNIAQELVGDGGQNPLFAASITLAQLFEKCGLAMPVRDDWGTLQYSGGNVFYDRPTIH